MTVDKSNSALLIIDVQNDFCPGGSLAVQEGDKIVPIINRLMPGFKKVAATQDWHPRNHVSFASNHRGKKPFDTIELSRGTETQVQVLWPDHCIPGTPGADFHPDLDTRGLDLVIRKGRDQDLDSYSAFFENDRRTYTGLEFYLNGFKFNELFLTGLATDFCVFYSAMDAVQLGFQVYLLEDAARGIDTPAGSLEQRLNDMQAAGVQILQSTELSF
ncbi:Nicotinamidase [subsurface metagenome]